MFRLAALLFLVCFGGRLEARDTLNIRMHDYSGTAPEVLERAEAEVSFVFRASKIDLVWIDCTSPSHQTACDEVAGPEDVIVRILPESRHAAAFGADILGRALGERYCDIFASDISRSAAQNGVASYQLYAIVIAHELGHLILGPGAHTPVGIMRPRMEASDFQAAAKRGLQFTAQQRGLLRERVQERSRGR